MSSMARLCFLLKFYYLTVQQETYKTCHMNLKFVVISRQIYETFHIDLVPGCEGQSVTCLAADMCLTADPGIMSSIPALSHTFIEIDHEIISTVIFLSADSRRVVVSYKRKHVHEVLVNCLVKFAQEKNVVR